MGEDITNDHSREGKPAQAKKTISTTAGKGKPASKKPKRLTAKAKASRPRKKQGITSLQSTVALASSERLQMLIEEADRELSVIEPKIEKLQAQIQRLRELQQTRQKLLAFKLSVQAIVASYQSLKNDGDLDVENFTTSFNQGLASISRHPDEFLMPGANQALGGKAMNNRLIGAFRAPDRFRRDQSLAPQRLRPEGAIFIPEEAFFEASAVLRRKNSINYELFKAIVLNGGSADTAAVKQYLVDHQILQPGSGVGFDGVPLTDISSRINYLVRKGVVEADGYGAFVSRFGWRSDSELATV